MEIENKENKLVFYFVDVQTNQTKESKEDNKQKIEHKEKNNIPMEEHTDDSLNKLVYDIFHVCEKYGEYKEGDRYYVINNLQMNLIINEVEWHKEFTEYVLKKKVKLQSREVLVLYQVFVTRILYMILINHNDNLANYVKTNDLKSKFDVLCDEFVKSIPDFKTNEDALNFLFDKILDTENCVDKNKNDNGIDEMKREILSCVKNLLENENDDSKKSYEFELCSNDKNKEAKTSSCRITGDGNKDENKNNDDDELELNIGIEKTKWQKDLGKEISLRQTEKIKMQNDIDYNKLKPIGGLFENNEKHFDAIWENKLGGGEEINDKTPISYKMLLSYLDKENENADRNFEAILKHYIRDKCQSKYLNPIIKVGIRSFKEIFIPNSVLKEYWTQKIIYQESTLFLDEKPKDNFEKLIKNLQQDDFCISYRNFGIFKYKDEDGNLYTHHLVLKNLGNFCETEQIVNDYKDDDKYKMVIYKIKVKPEYENDFKNIKIKPNTFNRKTLIKNLTNRLINWLHEEKYQKDILNQLYCQCLKLIPIEQLLKTEIYDDEEIKYLCDFDMLNDINDKCENIEQMLKQIIKEAMRKNNAIKMDENNQLDCFGFGKLDAKEKDDYIKKDYNYYNIFEGNNLFEIISKKLKDETIKIRSDNHEVIKAIFKTFKYKFDGLKATDNKENYFSQCCNLVKELCAKYEDEKEFVTCELFGTMVDHLDWFDRNIKGYAKILFQLSDLSDNKNYKFTTDQQIGFLKLLIDKLNDKNKKDENNTEYQLRKVFEIMIKKNIQVPPDQKVIDFLFLNINDAKYLDMFLQQIYFSKYNFSLNLNVVERMLDLFINDKNLQDDTKQSYLSNFVRFIILNDNINFISDDKKQIGEIKDLKEEQRQIRLNFIKMCLEKIKGNKKLISNVALNSFFKYFDNSLDIKKEIANYIKEYSLKIKKADMWHIFSKTNQNDAVEIKKILLKGYLRLGKTKYRPKKIWKIWSKLKSHRRSNSLDENDYFENYNNAIEVYSDCEPDNIQVYPIIKDDSGERYRKLSLSNLYKDENNIEKKIVPPANSTRQESFFNWIIYFAIALIVAIVILTFVFKEPLILSALLAPIIIFVYRCVKRCKKNNSQQEKPNLKTNDKDGKTSLLDKTQNMNLMVSKQGEKIILDKKGNDNLNKS